MADLTMEEIPKAKVIAYRKALARGNGVDPPPYDPEAVVADFWQAAGEIISRRAEGNDWRLPVFDRLCGHEQLAIALLDWRSWFSSLPGPSASTSPEFLAAVADQNLRRLIELAQFASCIPDEGRFPRFSLFVRSRASLGMLSTFVQFREPYPLKSPKLLTELATVLPHEDGYALHVEERAGELVCVGVVNVLAHLGLRTEGGTTGSAVGLQIYVEGPGHLRVREIDLDLQVQGGILRDNRSIYEGKLAGAWLEQLREKSLQRCKDLVTALVETQHTYAWNTVVAAMWAEVLVAALRQRHGGAIVVLPDPATELVKVKYPTVPQSYLEEINSYLAVRCRPDGAGSRDEASLETRHARLFAHAHSLAQLTAIDGCVVLDREFRLHGYGGKISADEVAESSNVRFVDLESREPRQPDEIHQRFGTRHRSAFNLCRAVPNALAFVLSQDGALRVFGSDDSNVFLEEGISPPG